LPLIIEEEEIKGEENQKAETSQKGKKDKSKAATA
jgi:hypothetical protein